MTSEAILRRKLARAGLAVAEAKRKLKEAKREFDKLYDIAVMRGWVDEKILEAVGESARVRESGLGGGSPDPREVVEAPQGHDHS
jgi:hypothetical protein